MKKMLWFSTSVKNNNKMKGMGEDYSPLPKEGGEQLKMPKVYLCTDPVTSTSVRSPALQQSGGKFPSLPALPDHIHALQNCLYLAGVAAGL